jgi:DNA-binding response OmpR family regulator
MASILIIDDESNIRMMIRLALQHAGHTVETAADGTEGLDKYGDGSGWDLILLDQRMPGMEGLTVLKQIRYHNPAARVVMITAFGTIDLAVEAMKAGATDFLRKPFTAEILRGAVNAAISDRSSGRNASGLQTADSNLTFGMTTINGFRIESRPSTHQKTESASVFPFTVFSPDGEVQTCTVTLPAYLQELVKAHVDRETMPGGTRFWQALAEEALANYLYQNASLPPESGITVEEFAPGLSRWVDAILAPSPQER